jgi:hypothetical protein
MTTKIIGKYNRKTPLIGVTGKMHKSAAEAKASFELYNFGFVPCEDKFEKTFFDAEGKPFKACPDFKHEATGVFVEFKTRRMNGKKNKETAERAMQKVEQQIEAGWIKEDNRTYQQLEHAWNHSIHKVAAVSNQLPANMPLALIYESEQDLNEERRCVRNGVFMLSLQNMSLFATVLRMASLGLAVRFKRNGFEWFPSALGPSA